MNIYTLSLLILFIFSLVACSNEKESCPHLSQEREKIIIPKTTKQPEPINSFTPRRIQHLTQIAIALEEFKLANQHYPISGRGGKDWNTFIKADGTVDANWIPGLVPTYIGSLPRDIRNNNVLNNQYHYMSNGANYKLIALRPEDCKLVMSQSHELIDPKRTCKAYGFWTQAAERW